MAEALVSVVLGEFASVIRQELEQEVRLVVGVRQQVDDLTTTLTILQPFLRDADVKQVSDQAVNAWLQELKQIAYDADDVLDEWRTTILLSQFNQSLVTSITKKISSCFFSPCFCFKPVVLRHQIGSKINDIKERLDAIGRTREQLNLDASRSQQVLPRLTTSSLVNVAEIHGRDADKKFIVDWLLGESSQQEPVTILSIVGTGGFGKTTLAQIVFKQEKTRFERAIWVCVSEPFDREKVAKEIIQGATGNKATDFVGWDALHQQLSDSIKGKQFLIVLDDVWSKDPADWEPFRLSLNGGARGSRVIVTTRHVEVAKMMGSSETHRLGGLSNQDCWLLFQQIAFVGRSQQEDRATLEELEEIGKEIAAKCKGVPLAAKTIAGLMKCKLTKDEWKDVLESDIWELKQGKHGFLPSLLLSYHDLTPDLKQCFLYCAIFPKDDIIEKNMLVKLWMAQGFLGLDADKKLEIIGGEYFDDLAMRSFFQDFEENKAGKIIKCKMHDLVHDFVQFLTKTECSILENNVTLLNSEKLRHINASDIDIESLSSLKVKKLRSLILRRSKPVLSEFFLQMTCLRSLDLSYSDLGKLPDEVERLLHLRYLDLSNTKLTELPEKVCNLYNLQTLKLSNCDDLCKLPEGTGRLLNLRHLKCQYASDLSYFPQGIGKLKHLRTLHKFVVSNANGGCKLEELKDLNLINGKLEITGLREVKNIDEAKRAELQRKANIVFLTLDFSGESEENENNMEKRMEEIVKGLQPHNNLERLQIFEYPGLAFPSWMSTMSNIVELMLLNCPKLEALPATISKLPSLVRLELFIMRLSGDVLGICGFVNGESMPLFPKLTSLELMAMYEWEEEIHEQTIVPTISIMPNLRRLCIWSCRKLKVIPNYLFSHNLKELEIENCPALTRMSSLESSLDLIGDVPMINGSNNKHNLKSFELLGSRQPQPSTELIRMPSLLESLNFRGDVGVFSRSLTPIITGSNHNLKTFTLYESPHSSLPQGLNHFKSLQELYIEWCDSIDFNPEEELSSEHFPNLRKLVICDCGDLMRERCSRVNWSNLSHISEIEVDNKRIRG